MSALRKTAQPYPRFAESTILNGWMLTLADLLTLLLVFFVLQFAMQQHKPLPAEEGQADALATPATSAVEPLLPAILSPDIAREISSTRDQAETIVRFLRSPFLGKSDELSLQGTEIVRALAKAFVERGVEIHIATHADSVDPEGRFASKWELTEAQALVIARQMIDAGFPAERISTAAYGDSVPVLRGSFGLPHHQNERVELHFRKVKDPMETETKVL